MSALEEAARNYVWASRSAAEASSWRLSEAMAQVAETFHDLQVIAAGDCTICDPGSCPGVIGMISTPDLQHYRATELEAPCLPGLAL